jgi:L-asparaginase
MIQVFVTGGTFDKEYNFITGELYFEDTHLKEMFERGRCLAGCGCQNVDDVGQPWR